MSEIDTKSPKLGPNSQKIREDIKLSNISLKPQNNSIQHNNQKEQKKEKKPFHEYQQFKGHKGNLSGRELIKDEKTGFLESPRIDGLSAEKKQLILNRIRDGESVTHALQTYNVSAGSWYRHVAADPKLREECDHLKTVFAHRVEDVLLHQALQPNKTIDRIFYLKSWLPHRYNPQQSSEQTLNINVNFNGMESAKKRAEVIDAEIVNKNRKHNINEIRTLHS